MKDLARNIKAVAKVHGFDSVEDIAAALQIDRNTVSRNINNDNVKLSTLQKIVDLWKGDVSEFFTFAESARKSEISGFLKINGEIIEVNTLDDLQHIINQHQAQL